MRIANKRKRSCSPREYRRGQRIRTKFQSHHPTYAFVCEEVARRDEAQHAREDGAVRRRVGVERRLRGKVRVDGARDQIRQNKLLVRAHLLLDLTGRTVLQVAGTSDGAWRRKQGP